MAIDWSVLFAPNQGQEAVNNIFKLSQEVADRDLRAAQSKLSASMQNKALEYNKQAADADRPIAQANADSNTLNSLSNASNAQKNDMFESSKFQAQQQAQAEQAALEREARAQQEQQRNEVRLQEAQMRADNDAKDRQIRSEQIQQQALDREAQQKINQQNADSQRISAQTQASLGQATIEGKIAPNPLFGGNVSGNSGAMNAAAFYAQQNQSNYKPSEARTGANNFSGLDGSPGYRPRQQDSWTLQQQSQTTPTTGV